MFLAINIEGGNYQMRCKTCGEKVNFVLIKVTAKWNNKMQKWDRFSCGSSPEQAMCDNCNSFNLGAFEC